MAAVLLVIALLPCVFVPAFAYEGNEDHRAVAAYVYDPLGTAVQAVGPSDATPLLRASCEEASSRVPRSYDGRWQLARTGALLLGYRSAPQTILTGQEHHVISRRIAAALDDHPTLAGQYTPRDPRLVTRAIDDAAHRGYQTWHRQLDAQVADWLARNPNATTTHFEQFLRGRYAQPDLQARFPSGL